MGLMMLAAGNGSKLNFLLEGPVEEAKDILAQLEKLFEHCFEEH
jgi:phosphotransferase system HPr-like phosphotransfer protein